MTKSVFCLVKLLAAMNGLQGFKLVIEGTARWDFASYTLNYSSEDVLTNDLKRLIKVFGEDNVIYGVWE